MLTAISFKAVMHWPRPVLASIFSRLIVTTGKELGLNPTSWEGKNLTGHSVHSPKKNFPIREGGRNGSRQLTLH